MTLRTDSAGRPVFANGAPMDLAAAEQAHRQMYPHLYASPAPVRACAEHQGQAAELAGPGHTVTVTDAAGCQLHHPAQPAAVSWADQLAAEMAELAELEQLSCGPDRDRPAAGR